MLTQEDVELIYETRHEITAHRQREITVSYVTGEKDEFTGEIINEKTVERTVLSVVTEISSMANAGADRVMENGIKYEKGDIWLSIALDLIEDIADIIEQLRHDEKDYVILAMDKKGIGKRNRYEVLARLSV